MTHSHKQTRNHRYPAPPSVELRIPKKTIDVEAWMGKFTERVVEREVQVLADKPQSDDSPAKAGPSGEPTTIEFR